MSTEKGFLNQILLLGFVFFFGCNGSISISPSFFNCKLVYAYKLLFEATEGPQKTPKTHVSGRGRKQQEAVWFQSPCEERLEKKLQNTVKEPREI